MFPHDSTFSSASTSTEIKQENDVQPEDHKEEFQEQVQVKVEAEEHEENEEQPFSQFFREKRIRKIVSQIVNEPQQDEFTNENPFEPQEIELNIKNEEVEESDQTSSTKEIYITETFSLIPLQSQSQSPNPNPTCEQICSFCSKKFSTVQKLKDHARIHNKKNQCSLCDFKVYGLGKLKKHELTHTEERPWKCPEPHCKNSYRQKQSLKDHEFSVHGKSSTVLHCQLCTFTTNRKHQLGNHLNVAHEGQNQKNVCSSESTVQKPNKKPQPQVLKLYAQNHVQQQQQQSSKPELKSFTLFYHCDHCDFFTKHQKQVALHLNTQHNLPRVILKKSGSERDLENKRRKEVENASLSFSPPRALHLRTSTQREKKEREIIPLVRCSQSNCSYSNPYKYNVRCHEFTAHGKRGDFKVHKCPYEFCSYETPRAQHINIHINAVHKQLKRFSCHLCEFKSATGTNLKIHVRNVHDKFKKFSCDFCSFKTGRGIYLQRHVESLHFQKGP